MENIVLFDGVCNLCNASVNFIIDADKHKKFRFGSLQNINSYPLPLVIENSTLPDSVVLIQNNCVYTHSTAALRILKALPFPYPILYYMCIWIPPFMRDFVYNKVAKNRYRWFGKSQACRMPTPELKERFL